MAGGGGIEDCCLKYQSNNVGCFSSLVLRRRL
jgi:hypothetical protein